MPENHSDLAFRIPDNPRLTLALLLQLLHKSRNSFLGLLGRLWISLKGDVQDISLLAAGREQGEGDIELCALVPYQKDSQFTFDPIYNSSHFSSSWRMAHFAGHIPVRPGVCAATETYLITRLYLFSPLAARIMILIRLRGADESLLRSRGDGGDRRSGHCDGGDRSLRRGAGRVPGLLLRGDGIALPVGGHYDVTAGIRSVDLRAGALQGAQGLS